MIYFISEVDLPKLIKLIIAKILLKFMVSLFGGGRIDKNKKLIEEEVKKIDVYIVELHNELIAKKPASIVFYLDYNLKNAMRIIDIILKYIKIYKKLLKSYGYNLYNFPEIHQLENSIKEFLKMLEEIYKEAVELHYTITFDIIIQKIEIELHKISDFWNKHKYELHKLGIIK